MQLPIVIRAQNAFIFFKQIEKFQKGEISRLEPLRGWIKDAQNVGETAVSPSLYDKKSSAQKIFGSKLFLKK